MPHRFQRNVLLPLLFIGVAVLTARCSGSSAPVQRPNGLTCQTHNSASNGGLTVTTETDCSFKCPDGRLLSLPEAVTSQSKDQLNFLFCGVPMPAPAAAPSGQSADSADAAPTAPVPLLNQQVDICDPIKGIMNFVLAQPPQDLAGKKLVVQIQGKQTPCSISQAFPGELSCKLPPSTSFPAGIVVRVNDQVVNLFPYGGANCQAKPGPHEAAEQLSAPVPPTPQPKPHPDPGGHGPHPPHPPKPHHGGGHGNGHNGLLLGLPI
jgi:hypothetical protein